jgi:hypothetical protein
LFVLKNVAKYGANILESFCTKNGGTSKGRISNGRRKKGRKNMDEKEVFQHLAEYANGRNWPNPDQVD